MVSSAGGTQTERSIEQPFGAPYDGIYRDGPGFTGHATDAASGLTYMQQRYYDPVAMRFLSVDPEQSEFSRYSYGANNPFKFVDPDGRENREFNFENRGTIPPPQSPNDRLGPALGVAMAAIVAVPVVVSGGIAVLANPVAAVEIATVATEIAAGDALGGAAVGVAAVAAATEAKVMFHYTNAPESAFAEGLWAGSSVTDELVDSASAASQRFGIPLPDKIIPIVDRGQFVPNKPFLVEKGRGTGGGTDYVNNERVPAKDILPAKPIKDK